jgi:PhnB protein
MKFSPCAAINFSGQCEAAFRFYERCLGAKILFMLTWGDSPAAAQAPAGWEKKILHGRISLGGMEIVAGDVLPDQYETPRGFSIVLSMDDPDAAERIFHALSENGSVQMPLQKTFWAARYGFVTDPFGIRWQINCEEPT